MAKRGKKRYANKKQAVPARKKSNFNKDKVINLIFILLIVVIGAGVCFTHFDKKLSLNGDNAGYIILGKSILQGKYAKINFPGEIKPHTKWPPGLPLIVAFSELISKSNYNLTKFLIVLLAICCAILFYEICKHFFSNLQSFLLSLFLIINANIVDYSHQIMTEVPFMFFTLLGFYFFLKRNEKLNFWRDKYLILSLISFSLSCYFRTAGIAVLASVLVYLLVKAILEKRWQTFLLSFLLILICVSPWQVRNRVVGGNLPKQYAYIKINPYRPELGNIDFPKLMERFGQNFNTYAFSEIPLTIITNFRDIKRSDKNISIIISLLILCLVIIGLIKSFTDKRFLIFALYGVFYIILIFYIPPVWGNIRLILPFTPFFIFFIFIAVRLISNLLIKKSIAKNTVFIIFFIILLYLNSTGLANLKASITNYPPNWKNYYLCAKWVKNNTEKDAIICCRKPQLFYLWSDRKTFVYAKNKDTEEVIKKLEDKKADYVIYEQLGFSDTPRFLLPTIRKHQHRFQLVYHQKYPDTYIFKFVRKEKA